MRLILIAGCWSLASMATACSLCVNPVNRATLGEEMDSASVILLGTLSNPRLNANPAAGLGGGTTDLTIERIVKNDGTIGAQKSLEVPRYLPVPDPKNPPRYLIFFDKFRGRLEPLQGVNVRTAALATYLDQLPATRAKGRVAALVFYGKHLDHPDEAIAADAFVEFAKAADADVAAAGARLDPAELRRMLAKAKLEPERLSLAAFLLGCCGTDADYALLLKSMRGLDRDALAASDGFLAACATLRPSEGWKEIAARIADGKQPFSSRMAALRAARMMHGWKGEAVKPEIVAAYRTVIPDGEFADMAIEDLRRWKWWDLTPQIAEVFGRPTHNAPILRHCIIRYALACPRPEAKAIVARARQIEPDWVEHEEKMLAEAKGRPE
jgi:hypothetical protein